MASVLSALQVKGQVSWYAEMLWQNIRAVTAPHRHRVVWTVGCDLYLYAHSRVTEA